MRNIRYLVALLTFTFAPTTLLVAAEENIAQQVAESSQALPPNGMIGEQVLEQYGKPEKTSDTIGNPPITIWHYEDFSVYFEFDRVIHTVATASSAQ